MWVSLVDGYEYNQGLAPKATFLRQIPLAYEHAEETAIVQYEDILGNTLIPSPIVLEVS